MEKADMQKAQLEVLKAEVQIAVAKVSATDEWFFRLSTTALLPFLGFLGYCATQDAYRVLLAALPWLTMIGVAAMGILVNHYAYATAYSAHLERRMNEILGGQVVVRHRVAQAYYSGSRSPVALGFGVTLILLVILNIAAYRTIDSETERVADLHWDSIGPVATWLLHRFWPVTIFAALIMVTGIALSFRSASAQARAILEPLQAGPASGAPAHPGPASEDVGD